MSRFLLYISIIFLLYQVAKRFMRGLVSSPQRQRMQRRDAGNAPKSPPSPSAPQSEIDYSKIRDADYRDIG